MLSRHVRWPTLTNVDIVGYSGLCKTSSKRQTMVASAIRCLNMLVRFMLLYLKRNVTNKWENANYFFFFSHIK